MDPTQRLPPWSDLPPELLGLVFLRLPTREDRACFPAVCRQWRSTAQQNRLPPPFPMPWLVLPGGSVISFPHGETFRVPEGASYQSSCGEWLFLCNGSRFLMNPFTEETMTLPSFASYSYYDEPVETVNDRIYPDDKMPGTWMEEMLPEEISVLTLIMCSTSLIAAIVNAEFGNTIALCRPGDAAWSVSAHAGCRHLLDIVFFQGKLYAIDEHSLDFLAIDIVDDHANGNPRMSRIERIIEGCPLPKIQYCHQIPYLLEAHGTLMMICRKISYTTESVAGREHPLYVAGSSEFEVLQADIERSLWSKVRSLGNDKALILGRGCSRVVCVSPYDLSRDCVFFVDDYTDTYFWKKTTTSCGAHDMKDGKIYFPLPMISWKSGDVPATWLFSQGKIDNLQTTVEYLQ